MGDDARAEAGREAREQRRTPREGVPITRLDDDNSQNYEGEELREFRRGQKIETRVDRLEVKHDVLNQKLDENAKRFDANITEIKGDVKRIASSSDTMVGELKAFMSMQQNRAPQADSLLRVVRETATETTTATLAERVLEQQDQSRKFRRTFILSGLKIAGGLATAGSAGAFIHWLLEKL